METRDDNNTNQSCKVAKLLDDTYTITKDCLIYILTVNLKEKTIEFNIRMQLALNRFEGIFTLEDFYTVSRSFYFYDRLDDIYQTILIKLESQEIDIIEDKECMILKFFVSVDVRKHEIKLKFSKNPESDVNSVINHLCKTVHILNQKVSELEEKLNQVKKENSSYSINNSNVVRNDEIEMLKKWINETNYEKVNFRLLYRSSKDGKRSKIFHLNCDNRGPTITLVKTTDGKRFGGFTTLNWDINGNNKPNDVNAFLFSLNTKKKLTNNDANYITYCHSSCGPTFGHGHDFYIADNHSGCIDNTPYAFGKNEGVSQYSLAGKRDFVPEEVEVYSVL